MKTTPQSQQIIDTVKQALARGDKVEIKLSPMQIALTKKYATVVPESYEITAIRQDGDSFELKLNGLKKWVGSLDGQITSTPREDING